MGHEQQGWSGGIRTLPTIQQASADILALQLRVQERKAALEERVEGGEHLGRGRACLGRYGLDLQALRQPLDRRGIDRQRRRCLAQGFRLQAQRVEDDDRDENQQQNRCDQPDPLGGLQKSTLS
jgi:hypothetical protein